jgi:hypothetical protein
MTSRRGSTTARLVQASTTARLVQAKTGEQLFERTQEHIRPLIGMIDELNEGRRGRRAEGDQTTTHAAGLQGGAASQAPSSPQEPLGASPRGP